MKKAVNILYIFTLIFLTLFSYLFIDANLHYYKSIYTGFYMNYRGLTVLIYSLLLAAFWGCYLYFIYLLKKNLLTKKTALKLTLLSGCILFLAYPAMLSFDIFNYFATAKVSFYYRENPYIIMPIEFAGDPLLSFMHAANKTALYAPVWIIFTALPYILSFNNFLTAIVLIKLLPAVFYCLSIFLLYRLSKSIFPVVIFGLNPLVLTEVFISGHNDIVMMGLALAAMLFLKKGRLISGLLFLLLSIGIKYATVFLIPVFIYVILMSGIFNYFTNVDKPAPRKAVKRNKAGQAVLRNNINWENINLWCAVSMFIIFLLSPLREEMYPWYSIWFFAFISLVNNKRTLVFTLLFLAGLMLRYLPFMYTSVYDTSTIRARTLITLVPLAIYVFYKYILLKVFYRIIKNN